MLLEEEKNQQQQQDAMTADEYAEAIKSMKAKYVPKEELEKAEADKAVLIKALAGEGPVPNEIAQKQENKPDLKELRKQFHEAGEKQLSNAEYIKLALELRQAEIDAGEVDPFLPAGAKINPTPQDIQAANNVAEKMQSWLDAATDENGKVDPALFNAFKNKGIAEDSPMLTARLRAANKARK